MKKDMRETLLAEGARIMHRKGFNHTGVAEIVAAAGVPKGSFYFISLPKRPLAFWGRTESTD